MPILTPALRTSSASTGATSACFTPMPAQRLLASFRTLSRLQWMLLVTVLIAAGLAAGIARWRSEALTSASPPPAPLPAAQATGSRWQDLTEAQRKILLPLAGTWDTLTSAHKGKWIALTQNYGTRSPEEQKKMQGRMLEWAGLSQSQREQARLNFAETKKISPSARAADWEAYQNLSAEEKRELAAKAKTKPTGAAVAVTPSPPGKLTAVPITRHTPNQDSTTAAVKPKIDANTLLPVAISAPLPAQAPAPAPAPASAPPSTATPVINADTLSPN